MKITGIGTVMVDSPGRKWTLVQVHTDEGIAGIGDATYSNKEPVVCAAAAHLVASIPNVAPMELVTCIDCKTKSSPSRWSSRTAASSFPGGPASE